MLCDSDRWNNTAVIIAETTFKRKLRMITFSHLLEMKRDAVVLHWGSLLMQYAAVFCSHTNWGLKAFSDKQPIILWITALQVYYHSSCSPVPTCLSLPATLCPVSSSFPHSSLSPCSLHHMAHCTTPQSQSCHYPTLMVCLLVDLLDLTWDTGNYGSPPSLQSRLKLLMFNQNYNMCYKMI
jgi:hypothetical protein